MNKELFPGIIFRTAASWRVQLDKRLRPLGLTQAKWRTLLHLARTKTPLKQTELASKMGVEAATVVGLIDRLEKNGLVLRVTDENDRRIKNVKLTEKAVALVAEINQVTNLLKKELLMLISEDELVQCVDILQKIGKALDKL